MSRLVYVGQWVALTTGGLAISLVIFQTLRALIKEVHLRRKGFAQVQPDEERGADGFVIQKRPSATAEKKRASQLQVAAEVVPPEKKERLLDQPPIVSLESSPGQKWRASLKGDEQVVLASRDGQDPQGSSTSPIPELISKPARERSPPPPRLDTRPARDRSPEPSVQPQTNVRWSITRDEPVLPTQPPPTKDSGPQKPPPPTKDSGQQTESKKPEAVPYVLAKGVAPAAVVVATPVGSRPASATPSGGSQRAAPAAVVGGALESKVSQSSVNKPASKPKSVLPVVQTPSLMDAPREIVKHEPSVSSAAQPPSAVPQRKLPPADLPFGMTYNATFTVEDQALGFELQFVGGCPVVTKVVDRSPAFVKGVSVQNRAVAVNGVPLRASWSVKKMSKQQWLASVFASRPLTITFEQPGVAMSPNQVSPPSLPVAYGNFKGDELC